MIGLVGFMLITGGVLATTPQEPAAEPPISVMSVSTTTVQLASGYQLSREFVGRVEARRQSRLSLELGGLLTSVRFDEGDTVQRGDVVATLDTQILQSRRAAIASQLDGARALLAEMVAGPRQEVIDAARAELQRWEAQRRLAEVTKIRQEQLLSKNAGSKQDRDDASFGQQVVDAQWTAAKARLMELENGTRQEQIAAQTAAVGQLQAELETIEINLRKSSLLAPFDGMVSERFIDEGTVIAAGTPVVELLESGQLDVRVGVSEYVLAQLGRGTAQQVIIKGNTYSALIRSVRPDRDQATRTVSVLMTLDAGTDLVRVGDLATVRIDARIDEPGFWLPISALTESYRGLWGCYVVVPIQQFTENSAATHALQLRELEVVHQTSAAAFVRGSLKDSERIVSDGIQRLVPNQQVRLATTPIEPFAVDAPNKLAIHTGNPVFGDFPQMSH